MLYRRPGCALVDEIGNVAIVQHKTQEYRAGSDYFTRRRSLLMVVEDMIYYPASMAHLPSFLSSSHRRGGYTSAAQENPT